MRPPWFEACPALAAAGLPVMSARDLRRPPMPRTLAGDIHRFCILRRPDRADALPLAYVRLTDLARHIHQARQGQPLQLVNVELAVLGDPIPKPGVSVWTTGDDGARVDFLGWCWLDGGDRVVLERVLFELQPQSWAA